MAIIGQSKNSGLYKKVTEEGSKYREIKYVDLGYDSLWDGQPTLHGYIPEKPGQMLGADAVSALRTEGIPPVTQGRTDVNLKSEVLLPMTARIDDTERIARLLTKVPGIKWQAHNLELAAIQNRLNDKQGKLKSEDSGSNIWETLRQVGRNLVGGAALAGSILGATTAQVAVAGTGEHFSAWLLAKRAYLQGANPAESALSGQPIVVNSEDLRYSQLPSEETKDVETARKAGVGSLGAKLPELKSSTNGQFSWSLDPGYTSEKPYFQVGSRIKFEPDKSQLTSKALIDAGASESTASVAAKPGLGLTPEVKITGDINTSYYNGKKWNPKNTYSSSDTYEDQLKADDQESHLYVEAQGEGNLEESNENSNLPELRAPKNSKGEVPGKFKQVDVKPSGSYISKHEGAFLNEYFSSGSQAFSGDQEYDARTVVGSGPWSHDGANTLRAGTAGSQNPNFQQDGNQTRTFGQKNMPTGGNVHTRVDNGRIDLIPFWIRAISADGTVLDNAYLFFEANLDSYSDNYDASWEGTQYVGRADKFWTYTGFDRQISFSFKMVAHTKSHLKPIYNRLNGLLSMTTPTYGNGDNYNQGGAFMQGVLAEVTIGDLLNRQLGFIKSVSLKWETDYMWEIDEKTIRVPHVLDVSVNFTPIHQFIPQLRRRYFNLVGDNKEGTPTFVVDYKKLYRKEQ